MVLQKGEFENGKSRISIDQKSLIAQAKKSTPLFGEESIPGVKIRFDKFGTYAGLFTNEQLERDIDDTLSKTWRTWTHRHNYDAKKNIFRRLGFDVIGLFVDPDKFLEFSYGHHWNEDFIIQQKDLFVVSVTNNIGTYRGLEEDVIFVLQYRAENRGEIAQVTVDYEKVAVDRDVSRSLAKVFGHPEKTTRVDKYLEEHNIHAKNKRGEEECLDEKKQDRPELVKRAYAQMFDDDDLYSNEKDLNELRLKSALNQIKNLATDESASSAQKIITIYETINA